MVSLALRFPVNDAPWPDFLALTNQVGHAAAAATRTIWNELLERVRAVIGPATQRPSRTDLEEDYLLSVVNVWDRPMDAEEIVRDVDLATCCPARNGRSRSPPARTCSGIASPTTATTWSC